MNQLTQSMPNLLSTRIGFISDRLNARLTAKQASEAAATIIGAYPYGKANDSDCYIRSLTALIAELPAEVAWTIADPRYGVVTTCKFLPTLAEVSEMAGELATGLHAERAALRSAASEQRENRRQIEERQQPISDEDRASMQARLKDLKAKIAAAALKTFEQEAKRRAEKPKPDWLHSRPRGSMRCESGAAIMRSPIMKEAE